MGLEHSAERGETGALEDGSRGAETADNSAAVNQRVAASFDSATVPIADPAIPVGVVEQLPAAHTDHAGPDSHLDSPVAFPSEQAGDRAQYWAQQGGKYRDYHGTCGLAASAGVMSEQSGRMVSEAEVVEYAADNGLCATEAQTLAPGELGGTTPQRLVVLQSEFGLDSRLDVGKNQADLVAAVESGDGVIAAVNCAEYWPDSAFGSPEAREVHRSSEALNHAVWVTGVSRSPQGEITGLYLNDTGIPGGAALFVDSNSWARAWQGRGGVMVTARRPK